MVRLPSHARIDSLMSWVAAAKSWESKTPFGLAGSKLVEQVYSTDAIALLDNADGLYETPCVFAIVFAAITRTPGASRGLELGTRGRSGAHTLLSWDVALLKRHL